MLRLLASRGHELVAVFTHLSASASAASVAGTAEALRVPVHPATEVREPALAGRLAGLGVELLLSVHSRHLIHADVLDVPALGAYNLHPGPLPQYSGMNVTSWALYEGAERHGVTLHHMTPVFDAGPIVFTEEFDLQATDTGLSVLMQCVRRGVRLVEQLLELLERGEPVPALPQELAERRWFNSGPPHEGRLDWSRPAREVVDFVRACDYTPFPSPWGAPRCSAHGLEVGILDAALDRGQGQAPGTVAHADEGAVLIGAADAWVRVQEVEIDGHRLPAADVLRDGECLPVGDPHVRAVS